MNKLIIALATFAFIACSNDKADSAKETKEAKKINTEALTNGGLKFAFFENDSLVTKYKYSIDLDEKLRRKERSILANRDQDMASFQEMYKTAVEKAPLMTTMEKQQVEQDLMKREQELMAKDQDTEQKYIQWKTDLLIGFQKHLDSLLTQFREEHGYDALVPSGGGITKFYYSPDYDVTDSLINYLNSRYKPEVGEKK